MKKSLFILFVITLISCSKGGGDLSTQCTIEIQYRTSSNCDDGPKIAIKTSFSFETNGSINNIEEALMGAETGECFLLSLTGFKDKQSNENLGDVFLVNDINRSWFVSDSCNP
jgi:hypothetical protein